MQNLLTLEEIQFKDIIQSSLDQLSQELRDDLSPKIISQSSTGSVKRTSKKGGSQSPNTLLIDFEQKALDVWSCVFWKAQSELENDIELVLGNSLRIWKSEQNDLFLSTLPKFGLESYVRIGDSIQSESRFSSTG